VTKDLLLNTDQKSVAVAPDGLEKYLGVRRFRYGVAEEANQIGQVTGLAWTEVGGELLTIEAVIVPGKGRLTITGKLGDVMQESIQAAMSVVRARSAKLGLPADFYQKHDFHVHVPEGATPKDGPSAGIAMCTAMVSALTKIPVRAEVAMTGEITLRGEVLPIGGLKEKLLAAHRGNIRTVLIPEENRKDLVDIPKNIRDSIEIKPVRWIDQVLETTLERLPVSIEEKPVDSKVAETEEASEATNPVTTH
jgi:ATP-dependent Lon protease